MQVQLVSIKLIANYALILQDLLLRPLRACSQIRPTPTDAIVFGLLPALRPGPNSTRVPTFSRSTDLLHVSCGRSLLLFPAGVQHMATLGMDIDGILLTWPIQGHLLFSTSNEMGSIPVRSWSFALYILFGQKILQNSAKVLVLEYFQDVAYSFGHFPRLCSIEQYA